MINLICMGVSLLVTGGCVATRCYWLAVLNLVAAATNAYFVVQHFI